MKIILYLLSIFGAFIILIGIASIIGYLDKKNCIKHEWQAGFVLLIIALSIISLAILFK